MLKVISVSPLENCLLHIELSDGRDGTFDVKPFMSSAFFSELREQTYFKQVSIFFSGVGWPHGQDLGPDTIAGSLVALEKAA